MYHTTAHDSQEITIRLAGPQHADELRRLAQRDSAGVPTGELLVALVGERVRAAVSIRDGRAIADPFYPTAGLVSLLSERVAQLRGPRGSGLRSRLGRRLRRDRSRRRTGLAPQPAGTLRALD